MSHLRSIPTCERRRLQSGYFCDVWSLPCFIKMRPWACNWLCKACVQASRKRWNLCEPGKKKNNKKREREREREEREREEREREGGDGRLESRLAEGEGRAGDGDAEWQKCFACPSSMSGWQEERAHAWGHGHTHTRACAHTHTQQMRDLIGRSTRRSYHLSARCVSLTPSANEVWPALSKKTLTFCLFFSPPHKPLVP